LQEQLADPTIVETADRQQRAQAADGIAARGFEAQEELR
jgi:hypothetical protein